MLQFTFNQEKHEYFKCNYFICFPRPSLAMKGSGSFLILLVIPSWRRNAGAGTDFHNDILCRSEFKQKISLTDLIKDNIEMCFVIPVYLLLWYFLTSLQGNSIIVG